MKFALPRVLVVGEVQVGKQQGDESTTESITKKSEETFIQE